MNESGALPEDRQRRMGMQDWFGIVLVGAMLALYLVWHVLPLAGAAPFRSRLHGNDFKHIYLGAWMLPRGENPYDAESLHALARGRGLETATSGINPYVYPPFNALVLSPLGALDPPTALRTWFWLNHAFLVGALALVFASLPLRLRPLDLAAAACLAAMFFPWHRTLTAGQLNGALLLIYAGVYALDRRDRPILSGTLAAFGFWFKLAPGALGLYFVWTAWRERRFRGLISMLVGVGAFLAFSVAVAGVDLHRAYLPLLRNMGYGRSTWAQAGERFYRAPTNQSLNSFFHHILADAGDTVRPWFDVGAQWANAATWAAALACIGIVLWRLWGTRRRSTDEGPQDFDAATRVFALTLLLSLLLPSLYWDHYAVVALWPLLVAWLRIDPCRRPALLVAFIASAAALSCFLEWPVWLIGVLALVAVGAWVWSLRPSGAGRFAASLWLLAAALLAARFPFALPPFQRGAGLLLMSLKLWGTLSLLIFWLLPSKALCAAPAHD